METVTITLEEYKSIPKIVLALTEIIEKQNEKIKELEKQNESNSL